MLGKLFKYDFKAISRLNLPLTLLVIGMTALGGGAMKLIASTDGSEGSFVSAALIIGCGIITVMSFLGIIAYAAICFISIYSRYYKNFFTDEGYLTFTLPVKTHSLLLSKFFAGALWQFIALIITVSMFIIAVAIGTAPKGSFINTDMISELFQMVNTLFTENTAGAVSVIFAVVFQQFTSILMIYLALTIGSTVANKQKILASVGFYFALNTGLQILSTVLMLIAAFIFEGTDGNFMLFFTESSGPEDIISGMMIIVAVFYFVVAAVEFFINNMILKKKLNLS